MVQEESTGSAENTYVVDIHNTAEITRLMSQDRLVTRNMHGPLSECSDTSSLHTVLDLACGPGGWVLDLAHEHPEIQVTGVDIDKDMIKYARAFARTQKRSNATFEVMNILEPLAFADNSFDLVNARYIYGFMPQAAWTPLLQECRRILRPGGILRLTEPEWPISTSAACDRLTEMFTHALYLAGRSFSPTGRHVGITPKLGYFLRQARFERVQSVAHVLDYSAGTSEHATYSNVLLLTFQLLQPFLLQWKVATQEELTQLIQQAQIEMLAEDFCGVCYYLTVWGYKPFIQA